MVKRGNKKQIYFNAMESLYFKLGKSRLITAPSKLMQTKISSHATMM
jgi:hypothetical protein